MSRKSRILIQQRPLTVEMLIQERDALYELEELARKKVFGRPFFGRRKLHRQMVAVIVRLNAVRLRRDSC